MVLFSSKNEFNDVKAKIAQILLKKMTISKIIIIIIKEKIKNKNKNTCFLYNIRKKELSIVMANFISSLNNFQP